MRKNSRRAAESFGKTFDKEHADYPNFADALSIIIRLYDWLK